MSDIINIPAVENSTLLAQNQLLTAQNEILQAQTEQLTTIARNLTSLVVSGITLKGTIGTGGTVTALPSTHGKGDAYIVIRAGTYAGASCAVGDVLVALGTSGTSASDWSRIAGFMASDGAAKYTIENYAGSSLLGTNQTIVSAFNALNSNTITKPTVQTEHDDLNNLITPGFYFTQNATIVQNAPQSDAYNSAIVVMRARTNDIIQFFISTNKRNIWWRVSQYSGSNWSSWFKISQT